MNSMRTMTLLSLMHLRCVRQVRDSLLLFFRCFRESVKKAEWSRGIESHQRIIDALKAGRVPETDRELRTHIESRKERV